MLIISAGVMLSASVWAAPQGTVACDDHDGVLTAAASHGPGRLELPPVILDRYLRRMYCTTQRILAEPTLERRRPYEEARQGAARVIENLLSHLQLTATAQTDISLGAFARAFRAFRQLNATIASDALLAETPAETAAVKDLSDGQGQAAWDQVDAALQPLVALLGDSLVDVRVFSGEETPDCQTQTPLPQDMRLTTPSEDIDDLVARFAGVWNGAWYTTSGKKVLCNTLVIEEVFANGFARLIYSYGTGRRVIVPRFFRASGRIDSGTLYFQHPVSGSRYIYRFDERTLRGTYNNKGRAILSRVDDVSQVGCGQPDRKPPIAPPASGPRDRLTAEDLLVSNNPGSSPIHNNYFMPVGKTAAALHEFKGTLTVEEGSLFSAFQDCRGLTRPVPRVTLAFFTHGDYLVPVARNIQSPYSKTGGFILSPGKVWSEAGDEGLSRASFPFILTSRRNNGTHNGIATFLYDHKRISDLRIQVVQETAPWAKDDLWGQARITYRPGPIETEARLKAQFAKELQHHTPIRPWSALASVSTSPRLANFDGESNPTDISANGLIVDGTLYLRPCRTRYGPYPYCRDMRHGVFSVTKSMGAALSMLRLAQKYGDEVFDEKIKDYVTVTATHNGWDAVTFGDVLNMATGVGDRAAWRKPNVVYADESKPKMSKWLRALRTQDKLDISFSYDDYPWGPGEVLRYNTTQTVVLAAAMDAYLKRKEGPQARLWEMMRHEVLRPIGVFHAPLMHTQKEGLGGEPDIPILGYGFYPTVDDTAKIATLLQNNGKHNGQQLLGATQLQKALYKTGHIGLPTGRQNRFGSSMYNRSFWSVPYQTGECFFQIPYMAGYGGNLVVLLPNGLTAFRFADGRDFDPESMILAAEAIRPLCSSPTGGQSKGVSETPALTASQLRAALTNSTFYHDRFHLYFRSDGHAFAKVLGSGKYDVGTWTVTADGLTCRTWNVSARRQPICSVVYGQDKTFTFIEKDKWRKLVLRREPGNPEGY